jgi:biopolymer transport protein TolR
MAMHTGKGRGTINEINVTPLVDVMLVLLVVFMVTTPIIVEETKRSVDIDLPQTTAQPVAESELKTLVLLDSQRGVHLDLGKGRTELARCDMTSTNFGPCLAPLTEKLGKNSDLKDGRRVFILADRALAYGFVVDVMAHLKTAGIVNIGMVTNSPTDKKKQP